MCIYAQSLLEQRNDMVDNSEQIICTASSINEKSGEAPSATATALTKQFKQNSNNGSHPYIVRGPGSSVGIATELLVGRSGIESRWRQDFSARPDWPWGPPSLLYNGYRVFPRGKVLPGRAADHSHHLLVPRSWKSRATPLHTLWATMGL